MAKSTISNLFLLFLVFFCKCMYSAEQKSDNQKPLIFILNGTSGAGKSTIFGPLFKQLLETRENWQAMHIDDLKDDDLEDENLDENDLFIPRIKKAVDKNKDNVLFDTVLDSKEELTRFIKEFKNYNIYIIMVHCNLDVTLKRLKKRNEDILKQLKTSKLSRMEKEEIRSQSRSSVQTLDQYQNMYAPALPDTPHSISCSTPDLHSAVDYSTSLEEDELINLQESTKNYYKKRLSDKFNIEDQDINTVLISPSYDPSIIDPKKIIIIDNSSDDPNNKKFNIQKILNFIEEKFKETNQ